MRKISQDAYKTFTNRRKYTFGNTEVKIEDGEVCMYLFGNKIAKTENGDVFISDGGYGASNTTRDRLNCFPVSLKILKGEFIVNEKFKWSGEWLNINKLE